MRRITGIAGDVDGETIPRFFLASKSRQWVDGDLVRRMGIDFVLRSRR
jgi:hypothetical protein